MADSLLKVGIFKAAITTYDFAGETKLLQTKVLTALKNNKRWVGRNLIDMVQRGDTRLSNMDNYGLTREEFEKMLSGFKAGPIPIYSDTSQISISKNKGLITFRCSGKFSLFNFLKVDTKANAIYFDNLKAEEEIYVDGKFYAPGFKGFESFGSEEISSLKHQTDITYFGLSIGNNKGDLKPALCLIYGKPAKDDGISQPDFLIMTIL